MRGKAAQKGANLGPPGVFGIHLGLHLLRQAMTTAEAYDNALAAKLEAEAALRYYLVPASHVNSPWQKQGTNRATG